MLHPLAKGPFGQIDIPYVSFGNINSMDLFGINEMVIFDFYNRNREKYKKVLDLGANIGLHSIIMARCGWEVRAFEPDPLHMERFKEITKLNGVAVDLHEAAVWPSGSNRRFVRVLGNTTGSHLAETNKPTHGPVEEITVSCEDPAQHFEWADLVKMDVEGAEADIVESLPKYIWQNTDCMLEVGSRAAAERILLAVPENVNMFSQKISWRKVVKVSDIPFHHSEGSLFITAKCEMP